jgi:hypothetical protein
VQRKLTDTFLPAETSYSRAPPPNLDQPHPMHSLSDV